MRRILAASAAALAVMAGSALLLAAQAGGDKKSDRDRIIGTWRIMQATANGMEKPAELVVLRSPGPSRAGHLPAANARNSSAASARSGRSAAQSTRAQRRASASGCRMCDA